MTKGETGCLVILFVSIGLLLLVVLLPLSFSYLDYWEYGLKQRKLTGKVHTDRVYSSGRYALGPDYKFFTYQADAHLLELNNVGVFSDGGEDSVGLDFSIDVDLTYFLKEAEIGELHKDLARTYKTVLEARTNDAIKNAAATVTFTDYFQNRIGIENKLKEAIQTRWDEKPQLHAIVDQFHVGRIRIPESVAEKQLSAKIQVETNKMEENLQQARVEREITAVLVNTINLEKERLLKETLAQASLVTANAIAEGERIKSDAINTGTKDLLTNLNIESQEYSIAYTYIRTLQNRENLGLSVSYLSDENIVKTASQATAD